MGYQQDGVSYFITTLQDTKPLPDVFNPWRDVDTVNDASTDAPWIRSKNLTMYLQSRTGRARLLLVGEAPGYQGCHFSGIAMTSERIILGNKPGIPQSAVFPAVDRRHIAHQRRTSRDDLYPLGANEPTATDWGWLRPTSCSGTLSRSTLTNRQKCSPTGRQQAMNWRHQRTFCR
jgi:hypothetical protein